MEEARANFDPAHPRPFAVFDQSAMASSNMSHFLRIPSGGQPVAAGCSREGLTVEDVGVGALNRSPTPSGNSFHSSKEERRIQSEQVFEGA